MKIFFYRNMFIGNIFNKLKRVWSFFFWKSKVLTLERGNKFTIYKKRGNVYRQKKNKHRINSNLDGLSSYLVTKI